MRAHLRDSIALAAGAFLLLAAPPARAQSPGDLATIKQAIAYLRQSDGVKALAVAAPIQDPAARALVTWLAIRTTTKDVGFDRTAVGEARHRRSLAALDRDAAGAEADVGRLERAAQHVEQVGAVYR